MKYLQTKVLAQQPLTDEIFILEVERRGLPVQAGQFFMLKCWDNELTLMRPISIFKADDVVLHFMYRVVGQGTARLSALNAGDPVMLLGGLGTGFPVNEVTGRVALLGGGLGIPPLCQTARELSARGIAPDVFLGYRDQLFALEAFEDCTHNIFVSSEQGPEGYRGFVTDLLKPDNYDVVFTCGPEIMMRKVAQMCAEKSVPCWCSMEHRMACGIGACLGCSISTRDGMRRVCKDGPVFNSSLLFA